MGRFVLFGGQARGPEPSQAQTFLSDTWEWDGAYWHFRSTNGPAARANPAMAYDQARGVTVMTGGFLNGPDPSPETVWEWDGEADSYVMEFFGLQYGDLTYDLHRRRSVWFGGRNGTPSNRTGFFDGQEWDVLLTSPKLPSGRYETALAYDAARRAIVLFGGETANLQFTGETWELITLDVPLISSLKQRTLRSVRGPAFRER